MVKQCAGQPNPTDGNMGEHAGPPLHRVVQWFKTMTTNEYIRGVKNHGWPLFDGKLWQRNYYEHIIRTPASHEKIADYIIHNPTKWQDDSLYQD
jgi:REP element-mobilizing transposase RayT